jgi:hypothetical protein
MGAAPAPAVIARVAPGRLVDVLGEPAAGPGYDLALIERLAGGLLDPGGRTLGW